MGNFKNLNIFSRYGSFLCAVLLVDTCRPEPLSRGQTSHNLFVVA